MASPPVTGPAAAHRRHGGPVPARFRPRRTPPAGAVRPRRRGVLSHWRQYLAISPFFLIFGAFPVFYSLYLAFQRWDGMGTIQFVGLEQFRFLWDDPVFWMSIRNTLVIWVLSTVPTLFGALVLATLLHSVRRFKGFYRIALYIPNVTSIVAVSIFFGAVFSNNFGLLNAFLQSILSGFKGSVVVLNKDMTVLVWSHRAEDTWGLRPEEVAGKQFLNLDIGLPVMELRQPIRDCLAGTPSKTVTVDAVNRRGKPLRCAVTCTPLDGGDDGVRGVILMMEDAQKSE